MGTEVKGGMYCPRCNRPVPAQKSTHKIARTALFLTAGAPTAGKWMCQNCGGRVTRYTGQDAKTAATRAEVAAPYVGYTTLPAPPGADKVELLDGDWDRPYKSLKNLNVSIKRSNLLQKKITVDDAAAELRKEAAKIDADAVINVSYEQRGVSPTAWKTLVATGTAVRIQ